MTRSSLVQSLRLFFLAALIPCISNLDAMCGSTVVWNGGSQSADVIDQNIDLSGVNSIDTNSVTIQALTCDIVINVLADAVINGNFNLYFVAAADHTITLNLLNDLSFTDNGGAQFQVFFSGAIGLLGTGSMQVNIAGGQRFTLGPSAAGAAGAAFYVIMNSDAVTTPTVTFARLLQGPAEADLNSYVVVSQNSVLSYVSTQQIGIVDPLTDLGVIVFDSTNDPDGTGHFTLLIQDGGNFSAQGHLIDLALTTVTYSIPAGRLATVSTRNLAAGTAGWRIRNENETYPDLFADPFFCGGAPIAIDAQAGFVLGANSTLIVSPETYIDYVGLALNQIPNPDITSDILCGCPARQVLKLRNPSALIIDGLNDPAALPATISLEGNSAIYFRSGVNNDGVVNNDPSNPLVVEPRLRTPGAGNVVLDVEGELNITGFDSNLSVINILSLEVTPSGGTTTPGFGAAVFPLRTFSRDAAGDYLAYNKAYFLINNRVNLTTVGLRHDDEIHAVYTNNSPAQSEPTYVGGETATLCRDLGLPQPFFALYNSSIHLHTSAAFSGVDIFEPNAFDGDPGTGGGTPIDNQSSIIFYQNGRVIDDGTGRQLVLGTAIDGTANTIADNGCVTTPEDELFAVRSLPTPGNPNATFVSPVVTNIASHLDIRQEYPTGIPAPLQILRLLTAANDTTVTEGIVDNVQDPIALQYDVQSIYLANSSNISIGTNGAEGVAPDGTPFALTTLPTLYVNSDFFAFATEGGFERLPSLSATTGQGGLFVDNHGRFLIEQAGDSLGGLINRRATMSLMVVQGTGGFVSLPQTQVTFTSGVGITHWLINLADPAQRVLVPGDERLSDFTMDWMNVIKDYSDGNTGFIPYNPAGVPDPCGCINVASCPPPSTPVLLPNLCSIPEVRGQVNQFQIKRSRIGDAAHLFVNGKDAFIRELVFLPGNEPGEAATGVMVVGGNARLGLGNASRNYDSVDAAVVLGLNGVTIIPEDVGGTVILNDTVIVNNNCHIVRGPTFGLTGPGTLTFYSATPKELRVKEGATLSISGFTTGQTLQFAGQARLVMEAGSRLIVGGIENPTDTGGNVTFSDEAEFIIENVKSPNCTLVPLPAEGCPNVNATDAVRVKISGIGHINLRDKSRWLIQHNSYVGVETTPFVSCTPHTDLELNVLDGSAFQIGDDLNFGGVFQIGDTIPSTDPLVFINFALNLGLPVPAGQLSDQPAQVQVGRQGFFGHAVGMIDKSSQAPDGWKVGTLFNVRRSQLNLAQGIFTHRQITRGNNNFGSLMAFGPATSYEASFGILANNVVASRIDPTPNLNLQGGGNIVAFPAAVSCVNPVVGDVAGATLVPVCGSTTPSATMHRNILASQAMIYDGHNIKTHVPLYLAAPTTVNLFNVLRAENINKVLDAVNVMDSPKAAIAPNNVGTAILGFITGSEIRRHVAQRVIAGITADEAALDYSFQQGSAAVHHNTTLNRLSSTIQMAIQH